MQRVLFGVLVLAFCTGAATGDTSPKPEVVLVESGTIDGIWSIIAPSQISIDLAHSAKFGPMSKEFCRFEGKKDHVILRCFGPHYSAREGTAQVDGNKVHLAWGNALARFVIDATLDTPFHFGGTFAFKVMGVRYDDPEPVTGEKLHITKEVTDSAGKGELLTRSLQQIADGGLVGPHDEATMNKYLDNTKAITSNELHALGAIQVVMFLGKTARSHDGNNSDFFSVYQVEFSSGERLCGLHQREDGVLDALICV